MHTHLKQLVIFFNKWLSTCLHVLAHASIGTHGKHTINNNSRVSVPVCRGMVSRLCSVEQGATCQSPGKPDLCQKMHKLAHTLLFFEIEAAHALQLLRIATPSTLQFCGRLCCTKLVVRGARQLSELCAGVGKMYSLCAGHGVLPQLKQKTRAMLLLWGIHGLGRPENLEI